METSVYESETIEKFVSNRSTSVLESIRKMLILDITLKSTFTAVFLADAILYYGVQGNVFAICVAAMLIAIPLILGQLRTLRYFDRLTDYAQSTQEKLAKTHPHGRLDARNERPGSNLRHSRTGKSV